MVAMAGDGQMLWKIRFQFSDVVRQRASLSFAHGMFIEIAGKADPDGLT
ncbi:MAG: hypothetical protein AAF206_31330 [Bacteroidota bacterium]